MSRGNSKRKIRKASYLQFNTAVLRYSILERGSITTTLLTWADMSRAGLGPEVYARLIAVIEAARHCPPPPTRLAPSSSQRRGSSHGWHLPPGSSPFANIQSKRTPQKPRAISKFRRRTHATGHKSDWLDDVILRRSIYTSMTENRVSIERSEHCPPVLYYLPICLHLSGHSW